MADMLVKLYDLPDPAPDIERLKNSAIIIRRAQIDEARLIEAWVREHFQDVWADCIAWTVNREPVACHIAVEIDQAFVPTADRYEQANEKLVGFSCYDTSAKGMYGPLGVREDYRMHGIGRALLLTSLHAMLAERYSYAIIGWAGVPEFYAKTVGAIPIEGSEPGIYRGKLTIGA